MMFAKRLREGVRRGEITCSIRFWMRPRVQAGGRYRMEEGEIQVDSIKPIGFPDITPALARESGFPALSICSRSPSTAKARISIWFGSTTCVRELSPQFNAGRSKKGNYESARTKHVSIRIVGAYASTQLHEV